MKRSSIVLLTVAVFLGHAVGVPAQTPQVPCAIGSILQPTYVNVGPTVVTAATTYPDVANAILAAVNVWNGTEAANRILYNGGTSPSDCPDGRPTQVGAFNFIMTNCTTTNGQGGVVAYTDIVGGTRSISLNLYHQFSTNPQAGQYDIQAVLAHEFGHMLGLWHMTGPLCQNIAQTCDSDPNLNTMSAYVPPGQTCQRDLAYNYDIVNANAIYPP